MKFLWNVFILLFIQAQLCGQSELLQSGPMLGYSEMREVAIWVQLKAPGSVQIAYWPEKEIEQIQLSDVVYLSESPHFSGVLLADKVEPGTRYSYKLFINGIPAILPYELNFQTQELWQWRNDPPTFAFTTGSCFYVNEEQYDRPGRQYGGENGILTIIHSQNPDFMIWLGDNTYLREVDWFSKTGIYSRYTHTRSLPELQPLLSNVHHYATWDDHDFGTNDSDRTWKHKGLSLEAFHTFWANPPFEGFEKPGVANMFQWADCDFFMLDGRFNKSPNSSPGVVLGDVQLSWLKEALLESRAPFKFISVGVMFLSTAPNKENFSKASAEERSSLIRFIQENEIKGVIFLTGDRHFSELSLLQDSGKVPIYDLTCSPLTAGPASAQYLNEVNDLRMEGTLYHGRNFSRIEVSGKRNDRQVQIGLYDSSGKLIWSKSLNQTDFNPK